MLAEAVVLKDEILVEQVADLQARKAPPVRQPVAEIDIDDHELLLALREGG